MAETDFLIVGGGTAGCVLANRLSAPNLRVGPETTVERLLFDGYRCIGATAIRDGAQVVLRARHVILSAGPIESPAILMRSGIGPASHLESLGIRPFVPLEGVGGNLQNHPVCYLATHVARDARQSQICVTSSSARCATAPATSRATVGT